MIVCTQCGRWIRKCQCEGQPETIDTETNSELSREQIETVRVLAQHYDGTPVELFGVSVRALCDMALRTHDAEAENARLRDAVKRSYYDGWRDGWEECAQCSDGGGHAGIDESWASSETKASLGTPEKTDYRCVKCGLPANRHPVDIDDPGTQLMCSTPEKAGDALAALDALFFNDHPNDPASRAAKHETVRNALTTSGVPEGDND